MKHQILLICFLITNLVNAQTKVDPFPVGTVIKINKTFSNTDCKKVYKSIVNGLPAETQGYSDITFNNGTIKCLNILDMTWLYEKSCSVSASDNNKQFTSTAGTSCKVYQTNTDYELNYYVMYFEGDCGISIIDCKDHNVFNEKPITDGKSIQYNFGKYITFTPPAGETTDTEKSNSSNIKEKVVPTKNQTGTIKNTAKKQNESVLKLK